MWWYTCTLEKRWEGIGTRLGCSKIADSMMKTKTWKEDTAVAEVFDAESVAATAVTGGGERGQSLLR